MKALISSIGIVASLLLNFNAAAQMPGAGPQNGFDTQLIKLFGNNTAFSAKMDVRVLDKAQKETAALTMDFALLDGNIRSEIDMANLKSQDVPSTALAQIKTIGMDKVVSITRRDTKMMYLIYPTMRATAKIPMPKEQTDALAKKTEMETTGIGKETVDGHSCVKNKVIFTPENGEKREALVWNATDLKNFPVRIQTQEKGSTVQMNFRQVQLAKPDAKLFEPPTGFTEYESIQALMMPAMQKMMAAPK